MNPESELKTCGRIACKAKHCYHQPLTAVEIREERREALSANARQVGGDHYLTQPIQPWDYIHRNGIGFLAGSAIKYLSRYKAKDGVQDLEKAKHFLEKLIEEEKGHTIKYQETCGFALEAGDAPCGRHAGHSGQHHA